MAPPILDDPRLPHLALNSLNTNQNQPPYIMNPCPSKLLRGSLLLGSLFAFSTVAQAQATDASDETTADEVITLSVFEVNAESDVGYVAENTLSGSRLNARLADTPAAINVFTEEFILDVAANSLEELVQYDTNVQLDSFEAQGAVNSGTFNSATPNQRNSFRSRGLGGGYSRDFYNWYAPQDSYNIDRVDFSKGPNGVLFGIGAIGGTLNASTKRALLTQNRGRLELQAGSWDLFRAALDYNAAVVDDKLAFRLNFLDHNQDGYRYHTWHDKDRLTLSAAFKPFEKTTIRASFEQGEDFRSNQRPFGVQDTVSEWIAAGSPLSDYNNGRAAGQARDGLGARNANGYYSFIDEFGSRAVFNQARGGTTTQFNDLSTDPDFRAYHNGRRFFDDVNLFGDLATSDRIAAGGPDTWAKNEWDNLQVAWEQRLTQNLQFELSYFYEELDTDGQNPGGNNLDADPNPILSDGGTNRPFNNPYGDNPYAGQFFIENVWRTVTNSWQQDSIRATLAYDLDFTEKADGRLADILGRHQIALMAEQHNQHIISENTFEVFDYETRLLLPGTNNNAPENGRNRIRRRNYVEYGDWANFHTGRFPTSFDVDLPQFGVTGRTNFVPTGTNAIANDHIDNDIYMGAIQSFFWDGRFVTTFGYRTDSVLYDEAESVRDAPQFTGGPEDIDGDGEQYEWVLLTDQRKYTDIDVSSQSAGGVFHVNENLRLFYNQSSGINLPGLNHQVAPNGDIAPGQSAESKDYGFTFSLFGDKFSGSVLRYEAEEKDRFFFQTFGVGGMAANSLEILQRTLDSSGNPLITQEDVDARTPRFNGSLGDGDASGYEFRIVGNPTPNLTLVFGYSKSERTLSNAFRDLEAYVNDQADYYNSVLATVGATINDVETSDGQSLLNEDRDPPETIADEVDRVYSNLITNRAVRSFGFGEAPEKVSSTINYTFRDGPLNGFSLGGTVRWRGKVEMEQVLDYDDLNGNFQINPGELNLDADGNPVRLDVLHGDDQLQVDLMARYRFKQIFGTKTDMDLQLNVFNVTGNDGILPQRLTNSYMDVRQYTYVKPTSWRLTARFRF